MKGSIQIINKKINPRKPHIPIGKGTIFENPYPSTLGRRRQILHYQKDFQELMTWNSGLKRAVDNLVEKVYAGHNVVLGCFCAPRPCHGHIIKEYVEDQVVKLEQANLQKENDDNDNNPNQCTTLS